MPYPNVYGGLSTGITSAGTSIADALRKLEEQKQQEEWLNKLKSYISGQNPSTPGPALTDWGGNVTAGQPGGTLPPAQSYGGAGYGAPVNWSQWVTDEPANNWGSNMAQGTGASGGSNKGGGNKGGG